MLRPYQTDGINKLREGFRNGHRCQIFQLATGGGKSICAATLIKSAYEKGRKPVFIVDRISLVDQSVAHLEAVGLTVGVIQGDHYQWNPRADVQVASIQTIARRNMPDMGFCIIDEVHCLHKAHIKLIESYNNIPFIGLSATPFSKGLGKYFTNLVVGATTEQLTDEGFLVPAVVYAPSTPDLSGVKIVAGEYHQGQLYEAVDKPKLVADIVETWLKLGQNRQTICFATNVAHSKHIEREFVRAGVKAVHIDAYTDSSERHEVISAFKRGDIKLLTSVGVLTTGFDAPNASCIILGRPTKSLILHIQMKGRGLRLSEGKDDCIVLDHAGNTTRLGFVTDPLPSELDDGKKKENSSNKKEREEPLPKTCAKCHFVKPAKVHICPCCGFAPEKQSTIEHEAGELVQLSPKADKENAAEKRNRNMPWDEKIRFMAGFKWYAKEHGYKDGWANHNYKQMMSVWPNDARLKHCKPSKPAGDVMNFIKNSLIRGSYAK